LIDASNGYRIWSESYERQLTDIFQLQDELARSLVHALRIQLSASETGVLVAEQTSKPEAYNALIRGRTLLNWSSSENLDLSISFFEQAVSADPDYAMAWGYLAWARSGAVFFRPTVEMKLPVAEAYKRALELNPLQSEALAAKAWMTELLLRDWTAANKLYLQAIASVDNTTAMLAYGMYFLAPIGRLPEALRVLRLIEQRDPLHPTYKATLAYFLLISGDAHAAIQKANEALELDPRHFFALIGLIDAYNAIGDSSEAEAVLKSFPNSLLQHPRVRLRSAFCDVARGDYDSARKIYRDLVEERIRYGNIMLARLALSLGETDQAIDHMEWELQQYSWHSIFIRILFKDNDTLRNNPRYLALLKRMGLDDASVTELHRTLSFD
jgi:tetratricopeptide (TPR) repeat protein